MCVRVGIGTGRVDPARNGPKQAKRVERYRLDHRRSFVLSMSNEFRQNSNLGNWLRGDRALAVCQTRAAIAQITKMASNCEGLPAAKMRSSITIQNHDHNKKKAKSGILSLAPPQLTYYMK